MGRFFWHALYYILGLSHRYSPSNLIPQMLISLQRRELEEEIQRRQNVLKEETKRRKELAKQVRWNGVFFFDTRRYGIGDSACRPFCFSTMGWFLGEAALFESTKKKKRAVCISFCIGHDVCKRVGHLESWSACCGTHIPYLFLFAQVT